MRQKQLVIIAVFALAGLAVSGLWLRNEYKSWPGVMLGRKINLNEPFSAQTLTAVWEQVRHLDQIFLPGSYVHLPGLVGCLMVMDDRLTFEQRAGALLSGHASTREALVAEPADAAAWVRLAWLRYIQDGPSADVVSALRLSIYTAPAAKNLLFWRIRMADLNRDHWDVDFENLVRRQIVYAGRVSQRRLNQTVQGTSLEDMTFDIEPTI